MLGNAVRRSIRNREEWACPKVSDLSYIVASFAGKIELETFEEGRESRLTDDLTRRAVLRIFGSYFEVEELDPIVTAFDLGNQAETGSELSAAGYPDLVKNIDGLAKAVKKLTDDKRPEVIASAVEFILEGLHLSRKLNCDRSGEAAVYKR
jgi:magnesium chelatase subunit I